MPDNSAILALPYIQPSQAQKHVTHNEALARLDVLVQLNVVSFDAVAPPIDPAEGETHALGVNPTDAWAGEGNALATWRDGGWHFIAPLAGWRAWGQTETELRIWDGTIWGLPPAKTDNLTGLGINTTADPTNRLSVRADATLLSHDGVGHQLKINKSSGGDTASVLFQSGWTGHAEMGLSGGTDFAIKVSDNGSSWTEALAFDGASGTASGAAVQSGATDATAGRLMTVGAFGLGTAGASSFTDANSETTSGNYAASNAGGVSNLPSAFTAGPCSLVVIAGHNANNLTQIATAQNANLGAFIRHLRAGSWRNWQEIITTDTSGDLNINNGTLFVDMDANRVGVGTSNPQRPLQVSGDMWVGGGHYSTGSTLVVRTDTNDGSLLLDANSAAQTSPTFTASSVRAASSAYSFLRFYSGSYSDREFQMSGDGNGTCDGSWSGGGADYAEYFEWADGNPNNEDRRGISVVLDGEQIRKAKKGEEPIGVISGNPSVVGDAAPFRWKGKYLRDDYGTAITEDYQTVSWTETVPEADQDGVETARTIEHSFAVGAVPKDVSVPKDAERVTQQRRALNPDYDPDHKYTAREDRIEWDMVGLMGKLRLNKGQITGARWIKMRKVSGKVEEWLVR